MLLSVWLLVLHFPFMCKFCAFTALPLRLQPRRIHSLTSQDNATLSWILQQGIFFFILMKHG